MVNLVDITDYEAPYEVVSNNDQVVERVKDIISYAQEKYLIKILGKLEYDKLNALNTAANIAANAEWNSFVNGTDYEDNGKTFKYSGIKKPLRLLMFYDIQKALLYDPIVLGYSKTEYQEGVKIFPTDKVIESWNEAVNIIEKYEYIYSYWPTVMRFLYDNETDYPDLLFTHFEYKNRYL